MNTIKLSLWSGLFLSLIACSKKQDVQPLQDMVISQNWQFKQVDSSLWLPATVPGCVHTDLLANKKIEDPFYRVNERDQQWIDKKDWEYKTTFVVDTATFLKKNAELYFEGLDTYADVYINDSLILKADNMFREWTIDVKKWLHQGENVLRILFHSPITTGLKKLAAYGYPLPAINDQSENGGLGDKKVSIFTRKAGYHYGWDWGPRFVTSGIWRPVHLLTWNNARINNIQVIQKEITKEKADLAVVVEIKSALRVKTMVSVSCDNDSTISGNTISTLNQGWNKVTINLTINHPKLWWSNGLGEAYLYQLNGRLSIGHTVISERKASVGIRTLKIIQKPDSLGKSFYVELNGIPVFMKGANYIPNDNFLNRVTPALYEKVIRDAAETNMNMLRVWGGGIYEDNYFYDLADKNGILLWQDFMFACSMYPGDKPFFDNVREEIIQNVKRLRNHPSIALWCGNNEIDGAWAQGDEQGGWGWKKLYTQDQRKAIWKAYDTLFHKLIPSVVAEQDGNRFYWPSSPVAGFYKHADLKVHSGDIHYWDVWWGQKPFQDYKTHIGRFMSEYGFQSFPEFKTIASYTLPEDWDIFSDVMKSHQRSTIGNGTIKNYMQRDYSVPADFKRFIYVGQVLQAEGVKIAMEAHRCKMPYCMGTLFWQINDCWPVASWSSTDYYHRWKAQHYFAKKSYSNLLVSPSLQKEKVEIRVVSDLPADKKLSLNLKCLDFNGKTLFSKSLPVIIKANTSGLYYSIDVKNLVGSATLNMCLLSVNLNEKDSVLADNILYFLPVKNLNLPKSVVQTTIDDKKNGSFEIHLSSARLVKNLYLSLENDEGFFSDNYFDILPGDTIVIQYKAGKEITLESLKKNLKMMRM